MSPTIEDTIDRVEKLYATITGRQPPQVPGDGGRIPPEIDPMRHVEDQLARLMSELERGIAVPPASTPAPVWTPRTFAWRDERGLEIVLDIPGVPRDQLELRVHDRVLVVRGERPPPWRTAEQYLIACETPFGRFTRAFALPERIEPSQISARLEAGTLRVRVMRSAHAEPSPIPISCS